MNYTELNNYNADIFPGMVNKKSITIVRSTSPTPCSSGLKSDFFCSVDIIFFIQPVIEVRILQMNVHINQLRRLFNI